MTAVVSRPGGASGASPVGSAPAARRKARLADRPWSLWLALAYVAVLAIAALAPSLLAPSSPTAVDYAAALLPPSLEHPFGTDESGRDLYTRVVHGAADSLSIGLGAAALAIVCAIVLGVLAALGPRPIAALVAVAALAVGQSIVWASSLSFLGLGVAPPSPEWGALLDAGRPYVIQAGWLIVIPGLVIVALALAATSIGRHLQRRLENGALA